MLSRLQASRGCGPILDCSICKKSGNLYAGSEHGDIFVWRS